MPIRVFAIALATAAAAHVDRPASPDGSEIGAALRSTFKPRDRYTGAAELAANFADNGPATTERFGGKNVVFVGRAVPSVGPRGVVLGFSGMHVTSCELKASEKSKAMRLHSGQLVVVSGKSDRPNAPGLILRGCSLDYALADNDDTLAISYESCLSSATASAGVHSAELDSLRSQISSRAQGRSLLSCTNPAVMVMFLCERADDKRDPRRALAETCDEPELQSVRRLISGATRPKDSSAAAPRSAY